MSGVGSAMRTAGIEAENAALDLMDYTEDPEVRPSVRRSILAAVTRLNDIGNRLRELAELELERERAR